MPISRTGPNALDFHLVFYLGHLTSKFPAKSFLVLSRDAGFDPMIEHARMLMFAVRRIEVLQRPKVKAPVITRIAATAEPTTTAAAAEKAPAAKAPATTTPVKKAAAPTKTPAPIAQKAAATKPAAPAKTPAAKAKKAKTVDAVVKEVLDGLTAKNRPSKLTGLEHLIESHFGGRATLAQVQDVLARVILSGGVGIDQGKLSYPAG